MPRYNDIKACFRKSIKQGPRGQQFVTTQDFVEALERCNWRWTLNEANRWIENQTSCFTDVTEGASQNRTFRLYNPNGGI
ncbi:hypothetical protein [Pantoea sp.]|uniref:hypothetical protein n=1 Tax=Pantoea sp. TaxID=69393 RepID=UPI0031D02E7B